MLVVTLVTIILHNLALAVIVVYCICIGFAWDNAKRIQARTMRRTGLSIMKYMDHYFWLGSCLQ
jgi:hypothetical protein